MSTASTAWGIYFYTKQVAHECHIMHYTASAIRCCISVAAGSADLMTLCFQHDCLQLADASFHLQLQQLENHLPHIDVGRSALKVGALRLSSNLALCHNLVCRHRSTIKSPSDVISEGWPLANSKDPCLWSGVDSGCGNITACKDVGRTISSLKVLIDAQEA